MSEDEPQPVGPGSGVVLADNGRGEEIRTLQIMERAVREDWPIPKEYRPKVIKRLYDITQRESVEVLTKAGPFDSVGEADKNATAAARVMVSMTDHDQRDVHHQEGKKLTVTSESGEARAVLAQLAKKYIEAGKPLPPMLAEYAP